MQQGQTTTREFTITGRRFYWREIAHRTGRSIEVQSGEFALRISVSGPHPASPNVFLGPVAVIGSEFPLGVQALDPPFIDTLARPWGRDRHNMIHDEVVKAVVQRVCDAPDHRRRPLNAALRLSNELPTSVVPESREERSLREAAQRDREQELAAVAERDARLTERRCPFCSQPCPSYRVTCKHCGREVRSRR